MRIQANKVPKLTKCHCHEISGYCYVRIDCNIFYYRQYTRMFYSNKNALHQFVWSLYDIRTVKFLVANIDYESL